MREITGLSLSFAYMKQEIRPVLTIAGSDCSGGAGVQADLKTMSAIGCYGMSVITALTAQNTLGVDGVMGVDAEFVGLQIDAVMSDIPPLAVKTGMLYSAEIVEVVAERMERYGVRHLIVDPVMVSTSGSRLIDEYAVNSFVKSLFPLAELVTPNVAEAEVLTQTDVPDLQAERILAMGPRAVLLKGGDRSGSVKADFLYCADGSRMRFESPAVVTANTHGTGCTLSSAIASFLAGGQTLPEAIGSAKDYVTAALKSWANTKIGHGHGPVDHFFAFR